jgi:hypothetical protein
MRLENENGSRIFPCTLNVAGRAVTFALVPEAVQHSSQNTIMWVAALQAVSESYFLFL